MGTAEAELGRFARGRRDEIAIATKFGIEPSNSSLARLQAPARAAIARLPALRAALKRRADGPRPPRRYDGQMARASLEKSLGELGTDYVDLFFVHDPGPGDDVDVEGLRGSCEELQAEGLIRAWGVSGDPDPCLDVSRELGAEAVLQVRDDILSPALSGGDGDPAPAISFGVLAGALESIHGHLAGGGERRVRWQRAIGKDCGRPDVLASLLLEDALDRNRSGTVLFSTNRPERIMAALAVGEAVSRAPRSDALEAFRTCVRDDLAGTIDSGG